MSNIIRIKRRLPDSLETGLPVLQSGELAFNEINKTLYYGASGVSGTEALAIAGEGTFATNSLVATLTADLQSQIGSSNSAVTSLSATVDDIVLDLDNTITSLSSQVDNLVTDLDNTITSLSSQVDSIVVDIDNTITSLSSEADSKFVLKSGDTITGSLTVQGDLSVLGSTTTIETDVTTTSAFSITNHGSQTALTVTQVDGTTDIAEFIDGANTALIIKGNGNVGIGTDAPSEKLTVSGNISASGDVIFGGTFEVAGGAGNTSLYVGSGIVGVNTETPNEAFTVVGSISASSTLYGTTLDVDSGSIGPVTFDVSGNITEVTSISAAGGSGTLYGFTLDGGEF